MHEREHSHTLSQLTSEFRRVQRPGIEFRYQALQDLSFCRGVFPNPPNVVVIGLVDG